VAPFNSGILFSYRDPAKDFRKVSDFDVRSWRPGLRELYERSEAASGIAAAVLAGHGGGGAWTEALAIADAALDAMESAGAETCERIGLHFLWRWAALLGNRLDPGRCVSCGADPGFGGSGGGTRGGNDGGGNDNGGGALWFIPGEGLLCKNCAVRSGAERAAFGAANYSSPFSGPALGPGARRWLLAVQDRDPRELVRYTLDATSLGELRGLMAAIQ
jgi:DNA repair protein RecO (recombination protein O)